LLSVSGLLTAVLWNDDSLTYLAVGIFVASLAFVRKVLIRVPGDPIDDRLALGIPVLGAVVVGVYTSGQSAYVVAVMFGSAIPLAIRQTLRRFRPQGQDRVQDC